MTADAAPGRRDDYIVRTIETVRNHRDADNCWPQWANHFADEIESLWDERDRLASRLVAAEADRDRLAEALEVIARGKTPPFRHPDMEWADWRTRHERFAGGALAAVRGETQP